MRQTLDIANAKADVEGQGQWKAFLRYLQARDDLPEYIYFENVLNQKFLVWFKKHPLKEAHYHELDPPSFYISARLFEHLELA